MIDPMEAFTMSEADKARRRLSFGGSDANSLMSGKPEYVHDMWLEKRSMSVKADAPTINMLMGNATEALNAAWYSKRSGDIVTDQQGFVRAENLGYPAHATLDGLCMGGKAIWEAKHTGGFDFGTRAKRTVETVAANYNPQLQHNMFVCGKILSVISVFFDNNAHEYMVVEADPFYQAELREAERDFWNCVESGARPCTFEQIQTDTKEKVTKFREVDMSGNNTWGYAARDYLANKQSSELFADSVASLKSCMEEDVNVARGHGVIIKRDKRGALSVREA